MATIIRRLILSILGISIWAFWSVAVLAAAIVSTWMRLECVDMQGGCRTTNEWLVFLLYTYVVATWLMLIGWFFTTDFSKRGVIGRVRSSAAKGLSWVSGLLLGRDGRRLRRLLGGFLLAASAVVLGLFLWARYGCETYLHCAPSTPMLDYAFVGFVAYAVITAVFYSPSVVRIIALTLALDEPRLRQAQTANGLTCE